MVCSSLHRGELRNWVKSRLEKIEDGAVLEEAVHLVD